MYYTVVLMSEMLLGVRVTCHSATASNHDTRSRYCQLYRVVTYSHLCLSLPVFVWQQLCSVGCIGHTFHTTGNEPFSVGLPLFWLGSLPLSQVDSEVEVHSAPTTTGLSVLAK